MTKLDGAQAAIEHERASIDLAWLSGHLVDAFEKANNNASVFKFNRKDGPVLVFDTAPILENLISNVDVVNRSSSHFLKGITAPSKGRTIKIGGRIRPGSEGSLKSNLTKLATAVDNAIAATFNKVGIKPADLWIHQLDAPDHLNAVAKALGVKLQLNADAQIDELKFAETSKIPTGTIFGRQITSFEAVEEGNRLNQIMNATERYFKRKKHDDVDEDIEAWIERGSRSGSFIDRFINFLDDEGLSRVRVAVSFRIMRAIADAAQREGGNNELIRYVHRFDELFTRLVETRQESLRVELAPLFGPIGEFDVGEELAAASFCRILPVWAKWESQLFERQSAEKGNSGANREICYHFRTNGLNRFEDTSTFLARVNLAKEGLSGNTGSSKRLAELLIYDAVLREDDVDPIIAIKQRIEVMKGDGSRAAALANLVGDLNRSEARVNKIANQMISILKTRASAKRIHEVTQDPISYFVNVTDGVLDKGAIGAATDHPFLVAGSTSEQKMHWLKNLRITTNSVPSTGSDFFAFKVTVHIGDRALVPDGRRRNMNISRLIDGRIALLNLLPMNLTPSQDTEEFSDAQKSAFELARKWRTGQSSLAMCYDPRQIIVRTSGPKGADNSHEYAQAVSARTALLVLMQVVGERLLDAMKADKGNDTLILYRHQQSTPQEHANGWKYSSEAIFTISQALEHALGKKLKVKLQGTVSDPNVKDIARKRSKSFDAIISAFDMKMAWPEANNLKKIGVIVFASRPCDIDESRAPSDRDTHVVVGRGYLFDPTTDGGIIRRRPNLLDTYEGGDVVHNPSVVKETVQDLIDQGCNHIVMVAHKYNGRSIGRSAERHRHHENVTFLNDLGKSFPKVTFHSVVKDSMKVVRVTENGRSRTAFEILGREAHAPRLVGSDMKEAFNSEGLIPFYSMATLHVVGSKTETGKNHQSGLMTYYMLNPASADGLDIRIGNTSLMTTGSSEHSSVSAALRGIHLIESEEGAMRAIAKPVLEPASWKEPSNINGAGEITALVAHSRRAGSVEISLTAVAAIVSQVLGSTYRGNTTTESVNV